MSNNMIINKNLMISDINKSLEDLDRDIRRTPCIIDITSSQQGRYIYSRVPFNTPNVMFYIFQAVSAWSNNVYQVAFFDSSNDNISIFGHWENSSTTYAYSTIFKIDKTYNRIYVDRFAQDNNITSNNYSRCDDNSGGAIRPNKIYAVTYNKDL